MEQPVVNGFTEKNGGRIGLDRPVDVEERTRGTRSLAGTRMTGQHLGVNGGNGR